MLCLIYNPKFFKIFRQPKIGAKVMFLEAKSSFWAKSVCVEQINPILKPSGAYKSTEYLFNIDISFLLNL